VAGVNATFYDDDDDIRYTVDCTSASEHKDPHNKFPHNSDDIGPGATTVSAFEGGCYQSLEDKGWKDINKMYITLQTNNPNACGSYSYPEPFNFSHTLNPDNPACP